MSIFGTAQGSLMIAIMFTILANRLRKINYNDCKSKKRERNPGIEFLCIFEKVHFALEIISWIVFSICVVALCFRYFQEWKNNFHFEENIGLENSTSHDESQNNFRTQFSQEEQNQAEAERERRERERRREERQRRQIEEQERQQCNERRYCNILGLDINNASPEKIKKAYHELAKKWHPDKPTPIGYTKQQQEDEFKKILNAYEALTKRPN